MATQKQCDYVAILFNDNGIDTNEKRKAFISKRYPGKEYTDELNHQQISSLIDELKAMKERYG